MYEAGPLAVRNYVWPKEEGLQSCVLGPHRHPPSTACSKTNHCKLRESHLVSSSPGLHECENSGLCSTGVKLFEGRYAII